MVQWLKGKELVETWMITSWEIWNNRNQCLHNLRCKRPHEIIRSAGRLKDDCERESRRDNASATLSILIWKAPPEGSFKLNVDEAFFSNYERLLWEWC